jgi:putative ABC transport system permease protein
VRGAIENIWQDLLYALRGVQNNPVLSATAVVILALSIGGNTALFTVIRSVLLKPLDYSDPNSLVLISGGATPTRFEEMKSGARSFVGICAFTGEENLTLVGESEPEVVTGVRVSAAFAQVLGVSPVLGNGFLPKDDSPGGPPVVMISSALWQRRFHGDPRIIGETVILSATPYTIVGVLPARLQFPFPAVDAWITRPAEWSLMKPESRRLSPFLTVFGRLRPGVSMEQSNAELAVLHRRYAAAHPAMLDAKPKLAREVGAMKDEVVGGVRAALWMLFGAVSFVLMIACANVASLLLARASSRSREFAVRSALGATRLRLISQLLTESVFLSFSGGLLGWFLGALTLRAIPKITAVELPRAGEIHLDWSVLAYAVALSIGTGVIFGLAPSLGVSQPDLIQVLRSSGTVANQGVPGRAFTAIAGRGLLVVGQVALSVVLLIGAALLMRSVGHLRRVDVGFDPANLLTLRISLPPARYETNQKRAAFFQDLVLRVASLPGVRGATAAMFLPMTGYIGSPVQDAGKPPLKLNERPIATILIVAPDYFRTLEIPLRRGRDFSMQDNGSTRGVAIIDEATARRFWPQYPAGRDPIGQHLLIGGTSAQPIEIVGIAAHVHQNLENASWAETVYIPFAQGPPSAAMLAVKTMGDPLRLTKPIREQVRAMDRDQPVLKAETMDSLLDEELGQRLLMLRLLGSFAGMALLLALIGVYGAVSYSVTQRTHELGLRGALGARQTQLLGLVMRQGLSLTLAGIGIGIGGAFALTRMMKSWLFQVSTIDPATFLGIALLFALMAAAATYIPARRATRIDPMMALRM